MANLKISNRYISKEAYSISHNSVPLSDFSSVLIASFSPSLFSIYLLLFFYISPSISISIFSSNLFNAQRLVNSEYDMHCYSTFVNIRMFDHLICWALNSYGCKRKFPLFSSILLFQQRKFLQILNTSVQILLNVHQQIDNNHAGNII